MLLHVSSRELSQWQAFEKLGGPIGPLYERAALRQIASLLDGSDNAKPFTSPPEMANYRAPEPYGGRPIIEESEACPP